MLAELILRGGDCAAETKVGEGGGKRMQLEGRVDTRITDFYSPVTKRREAEEPGNAD